MLKFIKSQFSPFERASRSQYALSFLFVVLLLSAVDILFLLGLFGLPLLPVVKSIVGIGGSVAAYVLITAAQIRRVADIGLSRWICVATAGLPLLLVVRRSYLALTTTVAIKSVHIVPLTSIPKPDFVSAVLLIILSLPELLLLLVSIFLMLPSSRRVEQSTQSIE